MAVPPRSGGQTGLGCGSKGRTTVDVTQLIHDAMDGHDESWLGRRVSQLEGRARPYDAHVVHGWIQHPEEQDPQLMFVIEEALGMAAGSMTRHLGYLPAGLQPPTDVEAAIAHDAALSEEHRRVMIEAYREAVRRH